MKVFNIGCNVFSWSRVKKVPETYFRIINDNCSSIIAYVSKNRLMSDNYEAFMKLIDVNMFYDSDIGTENPPGYYIITFNIQD